jgi:probable HAF family extracellular repeat protein
MTFTAWKFITAVTLLTAMAAPIRLTAQGQQKQHHKKTYYAVKDLGMLGGTLFAGAEGISNRGWVTGGANVAGDQSGHAFLWRDGVMTDLGTLGGLNSWINFPEKVDREFAAGFAETSQIDPLGENFCGWGTGLICAPFLWENGAITLLPTLGGNNGFGANINHRGQVVGYAETRDLDATCVLPQQFNIKGVVWGPKPGQMQVLPPFPGDDSSQGLALNDRGQVVGNSGACFNFGTGPPFPLRAVMWQNGIVTDLGTLGGTFNVPFAINNTGQVVGQSTTTGDATLHPYLWQNGVMTDLGLLPNYDLFGTAFGFNDHGQVVGTSVDPNLYLTGFIWQDGVITDLNTLVKPGSTTLQVIIGNDINDKGEIAGVAFDPNSGCPPPQWSNWPCIRAVLMLPCDEDHAGDQSCEDAANNAIGVQGNGERPEGILPQDRHVQLLKRLNLGRLVSGSARPN